MNFKEFLLNERFSLKDLGPKLQAIFDKPVVDMVPTPTSAEIPYFERAGKITVLLIKRNPILLKLEDGTEASFTYDEFRRISGDPAVGKHMTIVFQRHPHDNSKYRSKIHHCYVKD